MKRDDKVMIYQDPLTELKKEGFAILKKLISRDEIEQTEDWMVSFGIYETDVRRTIKIKES